MLRLAAILLVICALASSADAQPANPERARYEYVYVCAEVHRNGEVTATAQMVVNYNNCSTKLDLDRQKYGAPMRDGGATLRNYNALTGNDLIAVISNCHKNPEAGECKVIDEGAVQRVVCWKK